MKRIYLAGPLFSEAHRMWAKKVKIEIEKELLNLEKDKDFEVFWPGQEKMDKAENTPQHIFKACSKVLDHSDVLVAILDGAQIDDGTAWEIGYFYGKGKREIYGIRTDFRQAGETKLSIMNAMIEKSCKDVISGESSSEAVKSLIATLRKNVLK